MFYLKCDSMWPLHVVYQLCFADKQTRANIALAIQYTKHIYYYYEYIFWLFFFSSSFSISLLPLRFFFSTNSIPIQMVNIKCITYEHVHISNFANSSTWIVWQQMLKICVYLSFSIVYRNMCVIRILRTYYFLLYTSIQVILITYLYVCSWYASSYQYKISLLSESHSSLLPLYTVHTTQHLV